MTSVLADDRSRSPGRLSRRVALLLCAAGGLGALVALALYAANAAVVALVPAAVALAVPALLVKQFRLYWFAIFLLSLQLPITKNLNDGVAVLDALHIDYTIWNFTFEINISDLAFLVLLAICLNDAMFRGKPIRFPAVTWLAVGYLVMATISIPGSSSPYLGFVELFRQLKLFFVFVYAVNCVDSKKMLRVLAVVAVTILAVQGLVTIVRFKTGLLFPVTFGDVHQDPSQVKEYLAVDRNAEDSVVRAFGTLISPGATVRLCMMVIPFALLLSARNAMFRRSLAVAVATVCGLAGLILTFDRVYYITTGVQIALVFLIMVRDRVLKRGEVILLVFIAVLGLCAVSTKLYQQFSVREDSTSVRLLQYEAAFKMTIDHPLFGVGLNNATGQQKRYSTLTYNENDPNTQFYLEPTHNLYLGMASEIGIPGLVFFCAFFAKAAGVAWRQSRRSCDPEVRLISNAIVVVFLGVAVNGMMDPLQEYSALTLLWLYAGLSLNLPKIGDRRIEPAIVATTSLGRPPPIVFT